VARALTNLALRWPWAGRARAVRSATPSAYAGRPPSLGELAEPDPYVSRADVAGPEQTVADRPPSVVMPTTRLGRVVAAPIVAYRRWISPVLPPLCRFYPSCSEYALTAIAVHGPVRGIGLAIRRLLRCHPFHPGGIDHVPPRRPAAPDPSPVATDQEH